MKIKLNIFHTIDRIVLCIAIAHEGFFFSINSLLGKEYAGSNQSSSYRLFLASLVIYLFLRMFFKTRTLDRKILTWLLIPICFITIAQITKFLYGSNDLFNSSILYILVWQYMAILLSISLLDDDVEKQVESFFKYIVFILSLSVALASFASYQRGRFMDSIGGATYQSASYYAAFCFGMTLFYMRKRKKEMASKIETIAYIFVLIIDFLALILSGGRGAMILLIMYAFVYFLGGDKEGKARNLILLIALTIAVIFIVGKMDSSIVNHQIQRIFSYISTSGLDFTNTSGRNFYYNRCINIIKESNYMGNGLLSYYYLMNGSYPHNIFLEFLIEGGIIYLLIWLSIFVITIKHLILLLKNTDIQFILYIGLYPMCLLLFSGTYSYSMLFWLLLSFVSLKYYRVIRSY